MSQQNFQNNNAVTGACLCGVVRFQIITPSIMMNNCYCSQCRKASGASYGTFLHTITDQFSWLQGEDNITEFNPSTGNRRPFCRECGSRVPVVNHETKQVIIPAGLLDDAPDLTPSVNLYCGSKAPWISLQNDLPAFQENAPNEFWEPYLEIFQEKLFR